MSRTESCQPAGIFNLTTHIPTFRCLASLVLSATDMTGSTLSGHTGSASSSPSASLTAAADEAHRLSATATRCKHCSRFSKPELRLKAIAAGRRGLIGRATRVAIERMRALEGLIMLSSHKVVQAIASIATSLTIRQKSENGIT
jgi:hypothetical protein